CSLLARWIFRKLKKAAVAVPRADRFSGLDFWDQHRTTWLLEARLAVLLSPTSPSPWDACFPRLPLWRSEAGACRNTCRHAASWWAWPDKALHNRSERSRTGNPRHLDREKR